MNPMDLIEIDAYKPWLSGSTPRGYWSNERHRLMAIKWLFEERLGFSDEDIKQSFELKLLRDHNLYGLYDYLVTHTEQFSLYKFIDLYTNGRIKAWEMKKTPRGFFEDPANRIAATKWLIEDKMEWNRQDIINHFNAKTLEDNGLHSLYRSVSSYYDLLNEAYPGEFYPWEVMDCIHDGYWDNPDHCRKAIYWLVTQKGLTLDDFLLGTASCQFLLENSFHTIYKKYNSVKELKEDLFPGSMELLRQEKRIN